MFIQNNLKELKNQDEDEYNFIKKIISNTLSEKEAYQENIKKFSDRLKNDFLMQLFRGKLNNNAIQHMKKLHNVDVSDEANYIIMTAYLDDISLMHYEDFSDAEMDEKLDIAWLILKSTLDELLLQGELKSLSVKEDDLIYYLIDTGDIKPEEAFTQVRTIKNKLIDLSKNKFKISIFVALSNVHKGYEGIKKAYSQTDKAVEYYLLTGKEQAEPEQPDKLERPKTISFDFRKDIEQFTQSILAKEIGQAKNLLNNIFAKWFVQGRPPADIVKYRMSEVINACINSIENIKMSYDNHFMDCMQMMNILFNCKNTEDLQAEIQKILDYLEEYITEMDNSEPDIIQKSVRYMDDNYYDSDLNISSLANHFDINAPYLSRQFKKNTGMGPLEYLQLKRIEESKKLLRQTNESIKEISQKVGFTYEVSFIRVFKKFEGVTPGIFRG
jgi:YesN/AraC family two-component response regulator